MEKYIGKLINENIWDNGTNCEKVEEPCELIRRDEILKALRMIKKGKAADPTGIVSKMFMANKNCSVEWLTSLCNLIIDQGRIPDDWKSSILLLVFKMKKKNLFSKLAYKINTNKKSRNGRLPERPYGHPGWRP